MKNAVIAPNGEQLWRAAVDEREKPDRKCGYNNLWSPVRCTVAYIGTVPIGLTIIEMSEEVEARYIKGKYTREADYVPPERGRHLVDQGWTTRKAFATGRLCLQAYSPHPLAKWVHQWRETKDHNLLNHIPAMIKELERAVGEVARLIEGGQRRAALERQRWEEQQTQWRREEAERRLALANREDAMTVAKEKDTDLVLDRKMNLHEVDCKAIVALYGKVAEEQLEKLPENSQVLMLAVGVPGREADRMRDTLLQHTRRPAEQEQIAKLVDTLPPMAPPRHVVLEADMLARAKARILQSQDWITAREIAGLGGFSETNASAQPNSWKRAGRIFAINHKGTDYFPLYGLTLDPIRPLPAMKQVLDVLSLRDPWELAFWFDAANSCLDGRRPQEVIASEADKVLAAASEDANWVANG